MENNRLLLEIAAWLALGAALFALGQHMLRKWWRSFRARQRAKHWQKGENIALALLEKEGFRIEALQSVRDWTIWNGNEALAVRLRADALVERAGRHYVAEFKSGLESGSLTNSSTRRQLLEYVCAYGTDAVLLVDSARRIIHEVRFDFPETFLSRPRQQQPSRWLWFTILVLAAGWTVHALVKG